MIVNRNMTIDLSHDTVNSPLRFHEGDVNGTDLTIAVYNNNSAFDLTGITVTYDATIGGYLAESDHAATFSGNIITVPVTANMTALTGVLKIDVKLTKSSDVLIMRTITADVQRSIVDGSVIIDISGTTIGGKLDELEQNKAGIAEMTDETVDQCLDNNKIYIGNITTVGSSAVQTKMVCVGSTNLKAQLAFTCNGKLCKRTGSGVSPYTEYNWGAWSEV